ncbi:glycine--tRNA ligase subunit beta [Desulfitibacter alkalitolerans]|uniref:glycine--tRNA ligase subunit beta n=1 Tax=Desulfitibacter alkalitolerans TaxID=264641 RepID=UPI0004871F22|nr:glycine--tRNA ligase subunit beta [Desulfitibacter alkalitolerans]
MVKDFLFEIGTEEIPARFMAGALKELKIKTQKLLEKERLAYKEINTYGTPRRLTVYIKDLVEVGEGLVEEKKGPSVKAAFDSQGNYTKAAQGFARGQQIAVEDLIIRDTPGGQYLYAIVEKKGENIKDLFPKILPELILSLEFPKPMRWGYLNIRFVRPIRWLVCLYGNEIIPIEVEGVVSGRATQGHRFLGKKHIELPDAFSYFSRLEENYVIVDQDKRQDIIWKQIQDLARKEGGRVKPDPELLEEINFLLEYPTALCGKFAQSYLKLPKEGLITVMKEHQKYFPVWDDNDNLLNKFITVRNGDDKNLDIVVQGNEKVLEARLNDGKFFYEEDVKTPLDQEVDKLKAVVFQEKLGTLYQKIIRNQDVANYIADVLSLSPAARVNILRANYLAKADLVSNMVYEFPELQGIMGYYYALHHGEKKEVAVAIKEHYKPRFSGDSLPETTVGTVIAMADKIDTICGCFAAGLRPTGAGDPYALRRQAQGICYMMFEGRLDLDLFALIEASLETYEKQGLNMDKEETLAALKEFFKQRVASLLEEHGASYDVVNCVLESNWNNIFETVSKGRALMEFKDNPQYDELITAFTRAGNLAKNAATFNVNEDFFKDSSEEMLWNKFKEMSRDALPLWEFQEYTEILEKFSAIRPYIDEFFEKVMVMDKDEDVKNNRLALLKTIVDYLSPLGDLSKLL